MRLQLDAHVVDPASCFPACWHSGRVAHSLRTRRLRNGGKRGCTHGAHLSRPRNAYSKRQCLVRALGATEGAVKAFSAVSDNSYESRVLGCLLGSACGDVLGHPVEGLGLAALKALSPEGVINFDLRPAWPLAGRYSGDTQLSLGATRALVQKQHSVHGFANQYVATYDPSRGYREFDAKVLAAIQSGEDPSTTGSRYLLGGFSLSGAARIAPLGLAYRNASSEKLREAVQQALLCTHTHPIGVEGAVAQAAGVAFLSKCTLGSPEATPQELLDHVLEACSLDDMRKRLKVMRVWLGKVDWQHAPIASWRDHLGSEAFYTSAQVARLVAEELQYKSTQAVATALWALCCHWASPEDAVISAVHFGGHTHTTAAMAGALAGALHGTAWIPERWLGNLENGPGGRDEIMSLGRDLARLDIA